MDDYLRGVFVTGTKTPDDFMPTAHISELWAFQYRLTEVRDTIDFLFELEEACSVGFAGEHEKTPA